ncbi:MAG: PVC-type heme-binding CxxCH protein [Pirellula sp.]
MSSHRAAVLSLTTRWFVCLTAAWMVLSGMHSCSYAQAPLKILFLGDQGHHRPADLYRVLEPAMKKYGIEVTYSEDVATSLTARRLGEFDGLLIYANIDELGKPEEESLLEYVRSGKGLIPLHCATYCFRNSNAYIELVGAQFKEHGGQRFTTQIVGQDHPIMKGFDGFESWDETYVHHKHNTKNRVVLEERTQGQLAPGTQSEPWTWVRTHGDGRVFYTAWGHNMDTWGNPGFQNLVARGITWACKRDTRQLPAFSDPNRFDTPKMTELPKDLAPFSFVDVGKEIPNYTPGEKWGVQGELKNTMQVPLTAVESQKHYVVPEGFEAKLWAIEKNVLEGEADTAMAGLAGKPIAMTWDHRGRLWVCETVDYPNELQPKGKGRDRIRICEDTNGDGKADKFTVFASYLSIPTAMACYRGGVVVQDGVKTVYLKDVDGDDVADMRQELITGWAMGDTHGGVSNFQYGLDNWIWGMQGYNDSHPVINGKEQQGFRQGFFRFAMEKGASDATAPVFAIEKDGNFGSERTSKFDDHAVRVSKLEFIRSTNNNTWGIGFSEEGLVFGSTANANPSNFMPVANRYYERVSGWAPQVLGTIADTYKFKPITDTIRQVDQHGGYTAAAGHALYTARNYPKQWWNRLAFVCEPTGHLIGSFVLNRDGAGYKSTSPFNLVASDDDWASPIMAEVGPDGNVWFLDWYNFIVQHNPTPQGFQTGKGNAYETKLRDKRFGRVYRLVYGGKDGLSSDALKQSDRIPAGGLNAKDEAALISALKHSNMLWRRTAQRLLVEQPKLSDKGIEALRGLVQDPATDAIGLNVGAIHAIWVLAAHGAWNAELTKSAFAHKSPGVQRNAIAAAATDADTVKGLVASGLLKSADAQVRLASLLKLADCPPGTAGAAEALQEVSLVRLAAATTDRWLLDAWTSAAGVHAEGVLSKLIRDTDLQVSPELAARIAIVAEHAARNRMKPESVAQLIVPKGNAAVTTAVIAGLSKGWPRDYRVALPEATSNAFVKDWLSGDLSLETKGQVIQLANALGVQKLEEAVANIRRELLQQLEKGDLATDIRLAAAKQMIALEPTSEDVVASLLSQATPQAAPELTAGLVNALAASKVKGLVVRLIELSQSMPPEFLRSSVRMMLSRPETTRDLIDAIEAGKLTINDLQLDQRQLLRDHPDAKIREKALAMMKSSGGIPNADRQKLVESWMGLTEVSGDAAKGKLVYQKHCALCHRHGDLGNNIGPELTGMAVHPKAELLVNILDPNRSVEGNFRTYNVQTTDGSIVTGMMAGESKTAIEIVNVQGKREVVLREDIERLTGSQKSLMPEGFESQMTQEEMKDLLEFLTSKGKYVPLSLASVATSITTKGMFFEPDGQMERLVFPDWKPKIFKNIPFVLIDPQGDRVPNAVMLYGPNGKMAPTMPKSVDVVCNSPAVAIHFLSGVGGWSFPASRRGSTSMIVRITYADDTQEDHELINGEHFADYIARVDVPQSEFAFDLGGRQMRYFAVKPKESKALKNISLIKGKDSSAPVVMAMTLQTSE